MTLYWQVVSILWHPISVWCVISIDINPWLRTWSCLGKLRKLSMTKDRGVCWSQDVGHLADQARPGSQADTAHSGPGHRRQNKHESREGHDITILLGSEYFLSCQLSDPSHTLHSHSRPPQHYLTDWNMTQEVSACWILVNLSPCHENCPRHAGLASWHVINARPAPRDTWGRGLSSEWWPGPVSSARLSEIAIDNRAESVCLFESWLCLDNFNVSWISRPSVWWMVQDSVLLVVKRVTQDFQLIY